MNPISNIWQHPRTSAAGVLISVATVAGVLAQQGVSLGHVGSGTVVSLACALATALLGLLARDPGQTDSQPACAGNCSAASSATAKLSAWLLIALLVPLPWLQGCTAASVAQNIVNWTPSLQSAVATVDSTAALLAPADAPVFTAATVGFDAASNLLVAQAKTYLANPTASTLSQLQAQVVTLQQQVNSSLLAAAHITDSASQQHAMAAIQAVATIVNSMLSLVESISSKAAVAQMAAASTVKLAAVEPYLDKENSARIVADHYSEPLTVARLQVDQAEEAAIQAGF
jgi:hypothetical protein